MEAEKTEALYQEPNAENIEDFIKVLNEHMNKCEIEGSYVEAEMAKNRINELKVQDYESKKQILELNQTQQRQECEDAHTRQYTEFNQQWDEDLLQTQSEDAQALGELEQRHAEELQQQKVDLDNKLPMTFKFSTKLLNLQKIQASHAKQKNYTAAHETQQQAQELEIQEREKYMNERQQKMIQAEATLMSRQQNEMNALKKKLEANLNERLKMRETEHNKLLQRYQNVKKEIENQQNVEMNKFEKSYTNVTKDMPQRPQTASRMGQSKMGRSTMRSSAKKQNERHPASRPSYMDTYSGKK